jgi:hypothetical protein
MTPLIKSTLKWMIDGDFDPVDIQWFDISSAMQGTEKADLEPLMTYRPPFEKCFVVWRGATRNHSDYEVMMLVAGTDPQDGVIVTMWKGPVGVRPKTMPPMVYLIEGDQIRYGGVDDDAPVQQDIAELMLAMVGCWYRSLEKGCESYRPEVKNTFTNRRKIERGKKPTYDWRTVIIGPKTGKREHQGGTHASPRLHDRRGHLRHLSNGKNVWVKACKVGNATAGIVFHDYEIMPSAAS